MMGAGQLVLDNVSCRRGGRLLFDGLSYCLCQGDAARITGANGVGKSSLLRLIAGLLMPESGTINKVGRLALANDAGFLDPQAPLAKALAFLAGLDGATSNAIQNALSALGIAHLTMVPVRILSTGQKKRAVLSMVVASDADIWLLDEPANGLDAESLGFLEAAIAKHRAAGGIVVVASHQDMALPGAEHIMLGPV